ncbi:MAG TPA: glycosyltransferase family 2 protein [Bryobacteraceae bacterium]|nr:glycosyltransferase family 2 protein [Bryobacteraceae bacterium]
MPDAVVTVVIPTLSADRRLVECLDALAQQTRRDFEVVIVDNSGQGLVRAGEAGRRGASVIEPQCNVGFGAAINLGFRHSSSPYLAALNDDVAPRAEWIGELVAAAEAHPEAGMFASRVRLYGEEHLDSAGMVIARDGSSKQRGHLFPAGEFEREEEVLLPSGSAAMYRRAMLEQIGLFDEDFFLYCEDTDLGLRARWAGWRCIYVPGAAVEHHYSHSAGRASRLKAYYVERNRLFVVAKNFPARMLWIVPFATLARYWWHVRSIALGRGTAAQFWREGNSGLRLAVIVMRAHWALARNARSLWRKRREIRRRAKLSAVEFGRLLRAHSIGVRRVAEL